MKDLLGMDKAGRSQEPLTSDRFEGIAQEIAIYLEGPVSEMLALHSGYARLEAYQDAIANIRLGGGCEGCPSSRLTLMNGVKRDLQDKFGEDVLLDVFPVLD
jgi:Fe/S biogenesis protein NfuA